MTKFVLLDKLLGAPDPNNISKLRVRSLTTVVDNILSSYDDSFDQMPEMIQNAMDSLWTQFDQAQSNNDDSYTPTLIIQINEQYRNITVLDNGVGVSSEHFDHVFQPHVSVKQLLGHKNARGHKGAAVVYLQFDHEEFEFQAKQGKFAQRALLRQGQNWLHELKKYCETTDGEQKPLPDPDFEQDENIAPILKSYDSGALCRVRLVDPEACELFDAFFSNSNDFKGRKAVWRRFEYFLRTRTGLGYVNNQGLTDVTSPEFIKKLSVSLEITFKNGTSQTDDLEVGYLYPHLVRVLPSGEKTAPVADLKANLSLLYGSLDESYIKNHPDLLKTVYNLARFRTALQKYAMTGYFSYANRNTFYEEACERYCSLDINIATEQVLANYFHSNSVNGGFIVAVQGFPNGRLQSFLQRGGSEDKSRTFVIVNFQSPYSPDYGRKNLAHDCREMINSLCKTLMRISARWKREYMPPHGQFVAHSATDLKDAKQTLLDQENTLRAKYGKEYISTGTDLLKFTPQFENDVVIQFVDLVRTGQLKGYKIYGFPAKMMLDGFFEYHLSKNADTEFEKNACPLGIYFNGKTEVRHTSNWLEYKVNLSALIDDFEKKPGESGKKWFETLDLLICNNADDQIDDYTLEKIDSSNPELRVYFGATHILSKGQTHRVNVIVLNELKKLLGVT